MTDLEQWLFHGDAVELASKTCRTVARPGWINCIITDPPYGVAFQSGFAKTLAGKQYTKAIANDQDLENALSVFLLAMRPLADSLAEQADVYVFTAWSVMDRFRQAIDSLPGLKVRNVLVWEKGWPGLGDLDANWANSFELILYAKKGRRPIPERRNSVIAIDRLPSGKMIHPTEKPVELIELLLRMSTDPGDWVVDPFAGSASTLLAARNTGRRSVGFEIDDEHFRRAKDRLSQGSLFG